MNIIKEWYKKSVNKVEPTLKAVYLTVKTRMKYKTEYNVHNIFYLKH